MIIWTRSLSDWEKDNTLFSERHNILHIPCVQKVRLTPPPLPPKNSLTVCTSPETAQILPTSDEKVICFGEKTFQILSQNRHPQLEKIKTTTAQGLLPYLQENYKKFHSLWLPGPKERAYDLSIFAKKSGWAYQVIDLYETRIGNFASKISLQTLHEIDHGVLCFASPSSVRGFLHQVQSTSFLSWPTCVIGETTQRFCISHNFENIHCAKDPNIKALYKCAIKEHHS